MQYRSNLNKLDKWWILPTSGSSHFGVGILSGLQIFLILIGPDRINLMVSSDANNFVGSMAIHSILNLVAILALSRRMKVPHLGKIKEMIFWKEHKYLSGLSLTFVFLFFMTMSSLWSNSGGNILNAYSYMIQILISGILISLLSRTIAIKIMSISFVSIGSTIYLLFLIKNFGIEIFPGDQLISSPDRYLVLGSGPNVWPRWVMFGSIFILWKMSFGEFKRQYEVIFLVIFPPLLWLILLSGSRAVYLATAICYIFLMAIAKPQKIFKLISQGKFGVCLALGLLLSIIVEIYLNFLLSKMFFFRIFVVTITEKSGSGRGEFSSSAIEIFGLNKIFGAGEGGFEKISGLDYPHNLFLETLVSGGIIGCALLGLVIWSVVGTYIGSLKGSNSNFSVNTYVFAICLGIFVFQQFSGSFVDGRLIFWLIPFLKRDEPLDLIARK